MASYRKKPVVIEAVQLTWQTWDEVCEFMVAFDDMIGVWVDPESGKFTPLMFAPPRHLSLDDAEIGCLIEGEHLARQGDWIIRGVQGEFYPCKPEIFDATYDPA